MAKEYFFQDEQFLPVSPEVLFSFFSVPENLAKITPAQMGFKVLSASDHRICEGTVLRYKFHPFGLSLHWTALISEWKPFDFFTDEQVKGPFKTYRHTHRLIPVQGGTLVRDELRYTLPLGSLGVWTAGWIVRRQMQQTFDFRKKRMDELFAQR